ncbi:MAG: LPS assembly protein LptD [Desulfuromonadia bacterium]
MRRSLIPLLLILLLLAPGADGEPLRVTADRMTWWEAQERLVAEGDVVAIYGDTRLRAPYIEMMVGDDRLTASGGVTIGQGGDLLTADHGEVKTRNKTGILHDATLRLAPRGGEGDQGKVSVRIEARRIEKSGEDEYRVDEGRFTTCESASPPWSIDAGHVDLTVEGYARATDARFRIAGIPVFWSPYLIFPVKTERQSGLLFPRFGNSSTKGVTYVQPLYLVISPSADTTITPRVESRRGWGVEDEFRYLRPGSSWGTVTGTLDGTWNGGGERGSLSAAWVEHPRGVIASRGDVTLVSDRNYLRDYGVEPDDYNRSALDSVISVEGRSVGGILALGIRTTRDLGSSPPGEPVQQLPFAAARIFPSPIGVRGFYGDISADMVSFSRPGMDVTRLLMEPAISADSLLIPHAVIRLDGGARFAGYDDSAGGGRVTGRYRGELSLSSRVERDFGAILHIISPRVGYRVFQKREGISPLSVDTLDIEPGGDQLFGEIATSLERSTVDPKGVVTRRDIARFRLSQGIDLSGRRTDWGEVVPSGDRLRDLRLEGTILPAPGVSIDLDTRYNPTHSTVPSTYVTLSVDRTPWGKGNIGWYDARGRFSYLEGGVTIPLQPVTIGWRFRYSPDSHDMLESVTRLDYRHQCWGFGVSYRERNGEREVMFSITLAGIGSGGRN